MIIIRLAGAGIDGRLPSFRQRCILLLVAAGRRCRIVLVLVPALVAGSTHCSSRCGGGGHDACVKHNLQG